MMTPPPMPYDTELFNSAACCELDSNAEHALAVQWNLSIEKNLCFESKKNQLNFLIDFYLHINFVKTSLLSKILEVPMCPLAIIIEIPL